MMVKKSAVLNIQVLRINLSDEAAGMAELRFSPFEPLLGKWEECRLCGTGQWDVKKPPA